MGVRRRPAAFGLAAVLMFGAVPSTIAEEPPAPGGDVAAAVDFMEENFEAYGLEAGDVADLAVTSSHTSKHSGVTHVNLNQRYGGLEVFTGHGTVNLRKDGSVLFVGESFVANLDGAPSGEVEVGAAAALESAATALDLDVTEDVAVLSRKAGIARETIVSDGGVSEGPVGARLGWQPTSGGLRLAWQMTIDAADVEHMWNATVDAETGELLDAADWVIHDRMEDLESTLSRGGRGRVANAPGTVFPTPNNPVNDGSSYLVYAVPLESPNDGPRELLTNPADGGASPYGWHDTDGAAGPEFTITRGNNVHAYLDQDDSESPDFGADVDGGAGLEFEFEADLNEHAQAYREAVTTNLFYGCNAIHDILWNYGFTEAAGNFQANNYGRGGQEGDYVRCEAADGSGTNNANFSTPSEPTGSGGVGTPRMQMYLWPGSTNTFGLQNQVSVAGLGDFGASWARFGPPAMVAGVTGTLVYAGTGCNAADYPAVLPGGNWIAVVDGGTGPCPYLTRAQVAESLGGDGVVLVHTGTTPPVMGASFTTPPVGIPQVAVGSADGQTIKDAIAGGTQTATVRKTPGRPGIRDGDFENGIIFHEFGHGVSNRLTGGPAVNCLSGNEQAGEGWSDYLGITLLMDPAIDDPDEPRGMGPYALFQPDRHGNGIRPRPYTRDMTLQPFTYDSIRSNGWLNGGSLALPHGLGHGWASVLWDLNWDLVDKWGFNPNIYDDWDSGGNNRALQYVMDGMKLQGCGPGLLVAARAVIASASVLNDGEDYCTVYAAFARRGLGFSAVQGTTNRNDNTEAFDIDPACRRDFLPPPTILPYGGLTNVIAGDVRVLRFTADGYTALDVLTPTAPYSRQVNCDDLQPTRIDPAFQTPKAAPELAASPGKSGLSVSKTGMYTFQWQTDAAWLGQCREMVLQRDDGVQHRAFFTFVEE